MNTKREKAPLHILGTWYNINTKTDKQATRIACYKTVLLMGIDAKILSKILN